MTARRAVVVHELCPHGTHRGPHYTAETTGSWCRGGPHRRLTEGQYVLVERDENGEWPEWAWSAVHQGDSIFEPAAILDALAQEST